MSFDYTALITDRARSDSDTLKTLLGKPMAEWTAEERTAFNGAVMKGSYDYTDLNRVDACLEDLVARLGRVGCSVPGYERLKIERAVTPSSRLPDGYTEVQYIQSTGTQYIDSGLTMNKADSYTYSILAQFSNDAYGGANGYMQFMSGIASGSKATIKVVYDGETHVERVYVDDTQKSQTDWTSTYNGVNVKIGILKMGDQNNGWFSGTPQIGKIFALTISNGGNLIRDFVPCIDPTGAVGLYDLVDGKFYGNAGTGVFLAGPPRATLPEGYTQLEYIQSSGAQYVDTGVRQNQNSRVVVDFQLVSAPAGSYAWIFEGRDTGPKNRHSVYATKSNGNWYGGYGSASKNTNIPYDLAARITADFNKNVLKIGNTAITFAQEVFQSSTSTVLFGCSTGGTIAHYAQAKLFGCRFFDGDTLLRDFIPCKNAGGAVGLYDLIGQKFYGNAGSGSFAAGPVVTWEAHPEEPAETLDPYTWYESDVPTASLLARYRANVAAVRAVLRLPEGTPGVPETMRRLTVAEANSIEMILLTLNFILNHIPAAVRHCGVTVCGSKGVRA